MCVSVAEHIYFSSSLVANAAQTRMYRKLSKERAHRLIMAVGYHTTRLSVKCFCTRVKKTNKKGLKTCYKSWVCRLHWFADLGCHKKCFKDPMTITNVFKCAAFTLKGENIKCRITLVCLTLWTTSVKHVMSQCEMWCKINKY